MENERTVSIKIRLSVLVLVVPRTLYLVYFGRTSNLSRIQLYNRITSLFRLQRMFQNRSTLIFFYKFPIELLWKSLITTILSHNVITTISVSSYYKCQNVYIFEERLKDQAKRGNIKLILQINI